MAGAALSRPAATRQQQYDEDADQEEFFMA
jgi:hypothetical protein